MSQKKVPPEKEQKKRGRPKGKKAPATKKKRLSKWDDWDEEDESSESSSSPSSESSENSSRSSRSSRRHTRNSSSSSAPQQKQTVKKKPTRQEEKSYYYGQTMGWNFVDIEGDGNCLYNAMIYHLKKKGLLAEDTTLIEFKNMIFNHLRDVVVPGEEYDGSDPEKIPDFVILTNDRGKDFKSIDTYIRTHMKNGYWGGQIQIQMVCNIFNVTIEIYEYNVSENDFKLRPPINVPSNGQDGSNGTLQLHYENAEHYNALERKI